MFFSHLMVRLAFHAAKQFYDRNRFVSVGRKILFNSRSIFEMILFHIGSAQYNNFIIIKTRPVRTGNHSSIQIVHPLNYSVKAIMIILGLNCSSNTFSSP